VSAWGSNSTTGAALLAIFSCAFLCMNVGHVLIRMSPLEEEKTALYLRRTGTLRTDEQLSQIQIIDPIDIVALSGDISKNNGLRLSR
jgi:hypothetical protein